MSKPELRFSAEYRCWPMWVDTDDTGGVDTPDPHTFGLPDELADALVAWADEFDALFDEDDFSKPLWTDPAAEADFVQRGLDLARAVAAAIGDRWSVRYGPRADPIVLS